MGERGRHRLFFLLVLLPMLCVFPYLRGVNNPNEFARAFTVMSLVEQRTFRIDEPVRLWGWINDMARVPSKEDGRQHYFMVKAPGVVYAAVPGYFLFSKIIAPALGHRYPTDHSSQEDRLWWLRGAVWAMRLWTVQIPCFLFVLFLERYMRAFVTDEAIRYTAVAAGALGTNFLAYTNIFASHSPYAALAFIAFATIEQELRLSRGDARRRRWSRAMLAGFCTSACVAFEYQSILLAIVLSVYGVAVFWRPTRLAAFAVGGLANVPHVMYFHWRAYGNPLTPGHQMLETPSFAAAHKQGLFGITWPDPTALKALAMDSSVGFFGMSPFMLVGLVGIPLLLVSPYGPPSIRRALRSSTLVWALACAALFGVNAGFVEWRGGWTVGPRYLVPCAPFFAFGTACAFERIAGCGRGVRAIVRGTAGGLALASILSIGTVGLLYDTLPEQIQRPFAQFSVPLVLTGFVPHHVGEWFGWASTTFWYVALGALLATVLVSGLAFGSDVGLRWLARAGAFGLALAVGMVPALTKPEDGSELFVLHPSTRGLLGVWEPSGRDRITLLRNEAERYGPRRPCIWHRLAKWDRVIGADDQAVRDEQRAQGFPVSRCPKTYF